MEKKKCNHCKGEGKHRVSDTDWDDCVSCNGEGFIIIQPSPVSLDTHTAEEILKKYKSNEDNLCLSGKYTIEDSAIILAMTEYASLRENKAIQACQDKLKEYDIEGVFYLIEQLEKLKKPSL